MKGIIFNEHSVRAILEGRKTQTRRVATDDQVLKGLSRYKRGEVLYVKEPYYRHSDGHTVLYKYASNQVWPWENALFMPASCANIFIEITAVRAELLQDITEADAMAEGVRVHPLAPTPVQAYREAWNDINGKKHPWNPYLLVWVYEFKRGEKQ